MKPVRFLFTCVILASCGTYRYHAPTPNSALFKNKGEYHLEGSIGSSGAAVKTAASLPYNIAVTAMYNGSFPSNYRTKEYEFWIGYYTTAQPAGIYVSGGLGFGNNFKYTDSNFNAKLWEGSFYRPYIQFNGGITGAGNGAIKFEVLGTFKVSNFIYDGKYFDGDDTPIQSNYILLEPAFGVGIGGRIFQFQLNTSIPFRPSLESLSSNGNARTTPGSISFGLKFFIGR